MKVLSNIGLIIILLSTLVRCDDDEVTSRDYPRLITHDVSEITETGSTFNAEITYRGDFEITQYGFIWSESADLSLDKSNKVTFTDNIQSPGFSARVQSVLKAGVVYYAKSYLVTPNYTVYGNIVEFLSLGSMKPQITSIYPASATIADTVSIRGRYFSNLISQNTVSFNYFKAVIASANDSVLKVVVPENLTQKSSNVAVSVNGNQSNFFTFKLTTPVISQFTPGSGTDFTEVTINGNNFCSIKDLNIVKFGDFNAAILSSSKNQLVVKVPAGITQSSVFINVIIADQDTVSSSPFNMAMPVINSFQPANASLRQPVTISGNNFATVLTNNQVYFDNIKAKIISGNASSLVVETPDGLSLSAIKIKVVNAGQESIAPGDFHFLKPGISSISPGKATLGKRVIINGSNFSPQSGDNVVTVNGINAKIITNSKDALTIEIPAGITERNVQIVAMTGNYETLTVGFEYAGADWARDGTFPAGTRIGASAFVIGSSLFLGMGNYIDYYNDMWRYDLEGKTWVPVNNFPGTPRSFSVSVAINGKGYVGLGFNREGCYSDFWEYDPNTDTWTQLPDFPGNARSMTSCFAINDELYVAFGQDRYHNTFNDFYKFNPGSKQWTKLPDFPGSARASAASFTIGSVAYVGIGGSRGDWSSDSQNLNDFWKFDTSTNSWTRLSDFPVPGFVTTASFALNSRGYVGMGSRTVNHGIYNNDLVWEYEPQSDTWTETIKNPYGPGDFPTFFKYMESAYMIFIERTNQNPSLRLEVFKPLP